MKKIIILSFALLLNTIVYAQITLEHTYDKYLYAIRFIELEQDGIKYVQDTKYINGKFDSTLYMYNVDHSIYKTITFRRNFPEQRPLSTYLITQNLFNLDSKIEVLASNGNITKIYSEDGTILFEANSRPLADSYHPNVDYSYIKNTSNGTKMILGNEIYSLPGKLVSSIDNNLKINKESLFPYPNPSNNIINIPYQINSNAIASVTITDMLGKVVKTYKVDNTFNTLLVNLDDFSAGTYVYTIQKENDTISQGRFIVSK